ncbi:MAG: helix-turn-helix domain-containing protein [Planctomycetia bacterium]|nr:helix-turn-helix domain-containing protein [Planctomycetia bacterium]
MAVRKEMIALYRQGLSCRAIAKRVGKSKTTVKKWVTRATGLRLERVDCSDRRPSCRVAHNRIDPEIENLIVETRKFLKEKSILGECGARVIRSVLEENGGDGVPSVRTIHNVLRRNGLLDGNRRRRFPTPPPGWMIPDVRDQKAEMDSFDYIEDLRMKDLSEYIYGNF